jgi:hypothetical protein
LRLSIRLGRVPCRAERSPPIEALPGDAGGALSIFEDIVLSRFESEVARRREYKGWRRFSRGQLDLLVFFTPQQDIAFSNIRRRGVPRDE